MPIEELRQSHTHIENYENECNPDIAVIIPTFNERQNVPELIQRLRSTLDGLNWELIFVDDDSPDGTAEVISKASAADRRVRLIHRIGRRGLSSACIEGMLATSAQYMAVMDADLQHDETLLPIMLEKLRAEPLDVVVGTRNADGGSMGAFSGERVFLSKLGQHISRTISHCELSDPMSGFFLISRSFFMEVVHGLHGGGFKILLDFLATSARPVRIVEVGYKFRTRKFGCSKLDFSIAFEYFSMIVNKLSNGLIPSRFVAFSFVGTLGLLVHYSVLSLLYRGIGSSFVLSQAAATAAAMVCNFLSNDLITFRDRRMHGIHKLIGLMMFCTGCTFGGIVNVCFASTLLHTGLPWYAAALGGMITSAAWNYTIANLFVWRTPQLRPVARIAPYGETVSIR
ncbi:MAG TPA: glycosyltransferase [Terracidiphilus sp.]|jgi:dolichol-phosphate mannosyltransferase|nr:glycosyltransferase [Terracidiphilus sp.]